MAERKLVQPVDAQRLPSSGFFGRLELAIAAWLSQQGRRASSGLKATELMGLMQAAFPNEAPRFPSAVQHWLKAVPSMPGLDNAYMLAVALGVRPAWLAFEDGPMSEPVATPNKRRRRPAGELLSELEQPDTGNHGRKAG